MRLAVALLCLLSGCGTGDDQSLRRAGEALESWDAAAAAPDPRVALQRARTADPASIALVRALARAEADSGELGAALKLLDGAVPAEPSELYAHLLWDRAALRSRSGLLTDAAMDIRACLRLGVDARALAADPDLSPLRADPIYGQLLPIVEVRVREVAPSTEVLLGESWQRIIELSAPPGVPSIEAVGSLPPGLVLREVVEDIVTADEWTENRRIRLRYEAARPGVAHIPAHQVHVARKAATLSPRQVEVVAFGNMTGSSELSPGWRSVPVPSAVAGVPNRPELVELGTAVVLRWPAHAQCELRPMQSTAVALVVRQGGQPRWEGVHLPKGSGAQWSCGLGGVVSASGGLP